MRVEVSPDKMVSFKTSPMELIITFPGGKQDGIADQDKSVTAGHLSTQRTLSNNQAESALAQQTQIRVGIDLNKKVSSMVPSSLKGTLRGGSQVASTTAVIKAKKKM